MIYLAPLNAKECAHTCHVSCNLGPLVAVLTVIIYNKMVLDSTAGRIIILKLKIASNSRCFKIGKKYNV